MINGYQLSHQQKRIWESGLHTNQSNRCIAAIQGKLDIDLLKKAFEQLLSQNEILRTEFHNPDSSTLPLQVVQPKNKNIVMFSILDSLDGDISNKTEYNSSKTQNSFAPAIQVYITRKNVDLHRISIQVSPLIIDYESMHLLVQNVNKTYQILSTNQQGTAIIDEIIQYPDYSNWSLGILEGETSFRLKRIIEKDKIISGFMHADSLFDSDKSMNQNFKLKVQEFDAELNRKLENFVDVESILLATMLVTINRFLTTSSITIGIYSDGRNEPELKSAIGPYEKCLPLYTDITESSSIGDYAHQLKDRTKELRSIVDNFALDMLWGDFINPLVEGFPLIFEYRDMPVSIVSNDLAWNIESLQSVADSFELKFVVIKRESEFSLEMQYNSDRINESFLNIFLEDYLHNLSNALEEVSLKIADVPFKDNRTTLIDTIKNRNKTSTQKRSFIETLYHHAQVQPDKTAIHYLEDTVSYSELLSHTEYLAFKLKKLGITKDSFVGVYMSRCIDYVITMIALNLLKATAVPIDIDLQDAQKEDYFTIENLEAVIHDLVNGMDSDHIQTNIKPIYFHYKDYDSKTFEKIQLKEFISSDDSTNAYLMFTSGTSGEAKEVLIGHYHLDSYLFNLSNRLNITSEDCYLHLASISFSSSIRQLFLPLYCGAELVMASFEEKMNPQSFYEVLHRTSITVLDIVSSYLLNLVNLLSQANSNLSSSFNHTTLQKIIFASEPLKYSVFKTFRDQFGDQICYVNMYGQTETCGIVSTYTIENDFVKNTSSIPVGQPINDVEFYIVDSKKRPLKRHMPGELYIYGNQVGSYRNQNTNIETNFITSNSGKTLYATGDIAVQKEDGNYEIMGRIDRQLKIMGVRINPAQVETLLNSHPSVDNAHVISVKDHTSQNLLVAFFHPKPNLAPKSIELYNHLVASLPKQAMPARFVSIQKWPLTVNGKIDYDQLREHYSQFHSKDRLSEYREGVREKIRFLVEGILHVKNISYDISFFELGGNSLMSFQLISKLNATFQMDLTWKDIQNKWSIHELALLIESKQ